MIVLMTFNPFSRPSDGGLLNHVPYGINDIKGVLAWVRDKPRPKNSQRGLIITADVDGALRDLVVLADDMAKDNNSQNTRKFSPVRVAFLDWSWNSMDSFDLAMVCGSHKSKGSSDTR
jgi:hypothetical protein